MPAAIAKTEGATGLASLASCVGRLPECQCIAKVNRQSQEQVSHRTARGHPEGLSFSAPSLGAGACMCWGPRRQWNHGRCLPGSPSLAVGEACSSPAKRDPAIYKARVPEKLDEEHTTDCQAPFNTEQSAR